ncbi:MULTISPECIES: ScbA/BarX family gamma-butyrolactone biosynthesis protein [Streptomyces]|uniref:A-factor biosynthesis protein n=2 Tax=Streptomyces TaxID=1883 RepID=A0A2U9P994_STRAS|nr:ScbA/BarX family gamma-butyrolactone biosynthesis protein [Streptomyces actuosus]AWT46083.1 A-factor biosynthesis protein [Streptomyces actuosus]MBM4822744.1 A-factor biosynthesis protein [Streptomyces actuosus]
MPQPRQLAGNPARTATVPRQLVHRAAVAETLLTGWHRLADDRFTVAAQWPRAHGLHVSADWTAYDPLLAVETVRQSGTLLTHAEYDVPLGHRFVLDAFDVTTFPEHLGVGALPAEIEVDVVFTDVQYRGRRPVSARYTAEVLRCGERAATADVAFTCMSEAVYRRLRSGRTPETVTAPPAPAGLPPEAVDRALPGDVVLAPADRRGRWRLRVDTAHPVFFDHPLDHVPGTLLLEAARQATVVHTAGQRVPVAYRSRFHRYAELDEPAWIEVRRTDAAGIQVVGVQGGSTLFECLVATADR